MHVSLSCSCSGCEDEYTDDIIEHRFIDASISIRRTTHEFAYQLVVTRTFQEGEELLLEEDTESKWTSLHY